jgi:hypothetical protein
MMNLKNVNKRFVIGVLMVFAGLTSLRFLAVLLFVMLLGFAFLVALLVLARFLL